VAGLLVVDAIVVGIIVVVGLIKFDCSNRLDIGVVSAGLGLDIIVLTIDDGFDKPNKLDG
jgi:hypothetical protein